MRRRSHSLVVGKFLPPHRGHNRLIAFALARCDRVSVIACDLAQAFDTTWVEEYGREYWMEKVQKLPSSLWLVKEEGPGASPFRQAGA